MTRKLIPMLCAFLTLALLFTLMSGCSGKTTTETAAPAQAESAAETTPAESAAPAAQESTPAEAEPAAASEAAAEPASAPEAPSAPDAGPTPDAAPAPSAAEGSAAAPDGTALSRVVVTPVVLPLADGDVVSIWVGGSPNVMSNLDDGDYAKTLANQLVMEKTGVTLEYVTISNETASEKFNLMLSSNDLNDIISGFTNLYSLGLDYAVEEDEIIIDVVLCKS